MTSYSEFSYSSYSNGNNEANYIGGGSGSSNSYNVIGGGDLNGSASGYSSYSSSGTTGQIASDLLALNQGASVGGGAQQSYISSSSGASGFIGSSYNQFGGSQSGLNGAVSYGGSGQAQQSSIYTSEIENSIIRSNQPIQINESEEITVNGQRGVWANRSEVVNWRGTVPITQYILNEDANPEIITKRSTQTLDYIQELAVRYLRPPTPPAPGEIIIQQQPNTVIPPAPPLIIRQQPPRPTTPEPIIFREAPPEPPCQVGRKVIRISGKTIPPAPRKVIIERLAPLPAKPQSVIVERWLPYAQTKRRVIFQKNQQVDAVVVKPRNVIVQWEAPRVNVRRETKYLGVIRANPVEYVQRYGSSLKSHSELPQYVQDIKTPDGLVLAANYRYNRVHELEGDLQALRLVDLNREGLSEYSSYLQSLGISYDARYASSGSLNGAGFGNGSSVQISSSSSNYAAGGSSGFNVISGGASSSNSEINAIFDQIDRDHSGFISLAEAQSLLLNLNSRLGRSYGENELKAFFANLDVNRDGKLSVSEFRSAFYRL